MHGGSELAIGVRVEAADRLLAQRPRGLVVTGVAGEVAGAAEHFDTAGAALLRGVAHLVPKCKGVLEMAQRLGVGPRALGFGAGLQRRAEGRDGPVRGVPVEGQLGMGRLTARAEGGGDACMEVDPLVGQQVRVQRLPHHVMAEGERSVLARGIHDVVVQRLPERLRKRRFLDPRRRARERAGHRAAGHCEHAQELPGGSGELA